MELENHYIVFDQIILWSERIKKMFNPKNISMDIWESLLLHKFALLSYPKNFT